MRGHGKQVLLLTDVTRPLPSHIAHCQDKSGKRSGRERISVTVPIRNNIWLHQDWIKLFHCLLISIKKLGSYLIAHLWGTLWLCHYFFKSTSPFISIYPLIFQIIPLKKSYMEEFPIKPKIRTARPDTLFVVLVPYNCCSSKNEPEPVFPLRNFWILYI